MDIVIRGASQLFAAEVLFPALSLGARRAVDGLTHLLALIEEPDTRGSCEVLLDAAPEGTWADLDPEHWHELAFRLLFSRWHKTHSGWTLAGPAEGWATAYEDGLHYALTVFASGYPYWDGAQARAWRARVEQPPYELRGMPGFVAGVWEAVPSFRPSEVLSTRGIRMYRPAEHLVRADWCYLDAVRVAMFAAELPRALRALLAREQERIRPIEIPEASELLDYWLGTATTPPPLVVAFSGLGGDSGTWVREIAQLAAQIRRAALRDEGLTALITGGGRQSR